MIAGDVEKQRRQRYADFLYIAESFERAAARHDAVARKFRQLGQSQVAEHERVLAYEQRRKAVDARQRARVELADS
jgi:hypothetical protein